MFHIMLWVCVILKSCNGNAALFNEIYSKSNGFGVFEKKSLRFVMFFDVFSCNLSKNCDTQPYCTSNEWLKSLFFGIFYVQYSKTQPEAP